MTRLRDGDTVGRTGGDEMLVILPTMHNINEVTNIAERIRRHVAEPIQHLDQTIHTTVSIGATLARPGESVPSSPPAPIPPCIKRKSRAQQSHHNLRLQPTEVGQHVVSDVENRDTSRRSTPHPVAAGRGVPFLVSRAVSLILLSAANETVAGMTATTLGYARVSTTGQDLKTQLDALQAAGLIRRGCSPTPLSGVAGTHRPGLAGLLDYAREDDIVVVTAIDRLGRSVVEVTHTIAELGQRRILLRALREGIDTATPTGRAVAAIMATLAELELELGRERRPVSRLTAHPRIACHQADQSSVLSAGTNCVA